MCRKEIPKFSFPVYFDFLLNIQIRVYRGGDRGTQNLFPKKGFASPFSPINSNLTAKPFTLQKPLYIRQKICYSVVVGFLSGSERPEDRNVQSCREQGFFYENEVNYEL